MTGEGEQQVVRPRNEEESVANAATILRRRHHDIEAKAERARKIRKEKEQAKKAVRPKGPKSAESIVKEAHRKYVDKRRAKRQAKLEKPKLKKSESESKVVLAVRNSETHKSKGTREILKEFRIVGHYTATLLPNNKDTLSKLKQVEPFVFYGHPSAPLVRSLITKRGFVTPRIKMEDNLATKPKSVKDEGRMVDGEAASDSEDEQQSPAVAAARDSSGMQEPILLTDNVVVENHFGHLGMLSVDDLVHEIFTGGQNFAEVSNSLAPFKLENLRKADGIGAEIRRGYQGLLSDVLSKVI